MYNRTETVLPDAMLLSMCDLYDKENIALVAAVHRGGNKQRLV